MNMLKYGMVYLSFVHGMHSINKNKKENYYENTRRND